MGLETIIGTLMSFRVLNTPSLALLLLVTSSAARAQSLPPGFLVRPAPSATAPPIAATIGGQIIDRPPAQPRPRSHWGVLVGIAPSWTTPTEWGRLFFEGIDSSRPMRFEGRDLRLGVVRARPLGFEWGLSYVRKSVSKDFEVPREAFSFGGTSFTPSETYTGIENIEISGVDSHVVIPAGHIGRRVQIGALLGGGIGSVPETAVNKLVEGPPFYATCQSSAVQLPNPPASGGCLQDLFGTFIPLAPGARSATTLAPFSDVSIMDPMWLFWRMQLAVDVMVAEPLKVRFAGGFNFPSAQYFGVDLVYLFNTR